MDKIEKCRTSQIGRIVVNNGKETKRIYPEELEYYTENGYTRGFLESHNKNLSKSLCGKEPPNKGKPTSNETKNKISNSLMGHTPWNKGLTVDDCRVKSNAEKSKQTKIKKFGNGWGPNNMDENHKQKISQSTRGLKKKPMTEEQLLIKTTKQYLTRKKNNSFNTSKPEQQLYEQLLKENKNKTIYRNYKDKNRYPFYCDFYIKEDDLFIELNAHWTHGGKPYDPNDIECQKQLEIWQEKAKTSKFYENAIYTWTVRDVQKLQCAKEHDLNYKVIY